jgi:predicted ATPase
VVADAATARYRLLFTVRAFLLDELATSGETEEAHVRFVE